MGYLIGAYVLFLIALVTLDFIFTIIKEIYLIWRTPTTEIATVKKKPGFYEIKGKVRCSKPLFCKDWCSEPLAYYKLQISGVEGIGRNSNTETYKCKERKTSFLLEDNTGSIEIELDGAGFEATNILKKEIKPSDPIFEKLKKETKKSPEYFEVELEGFKVDKPLYAIGNYPGKKSTGSRLTFGEGDFSETYILSSFSEGALQKKKLGEGIGCFALVFLPCAAIASVWLSNFQNEFYAQTPTPGLRIVLIVLALFSGLSQVITLLFSDLLFSTPEERKRPKSKVNIGKIDKPGYYLVGGKPVCENPIYKKELTDKPLLAYFKEFEQLTEDDAEEGWENLLIPLLDHPEEQARADVPDFENEEQLQKWAEEREKAEKTPLEKLQQEDQSVPFSIEDSTGRIHVLEIDTAHKERANLLRERTYAAGTERYLEISAISGFKPVAFKEKEFAYYADKPIFVTGYYPASTFDSTEKLRGKKTLGHDAGVEYRFSISSFPTDPGGSTGGFGPRSIVYSLYFSITLIAFIYLFIQTLTTKDSVPVRKEKKTESISSQKVSKSISKKRKKVTKVITSGKKLYKKYCTSCHLWKKHHTALPLQKALLAYSDDAKKLLLYLKDHPQNSDAEMDKKHSKPIILKMEQWKNLIVYLLVVQKKLMKDLK
ncbi:hypothetical protein ACFL35_01485 [Candidatus Riflebacteria bacterium]